MTIYQYSYNVLIGFFKNYLTAVPDCTKSWPLLHDIELKIPQHFCYSFDGCLKEASLLVNWREVLEMFRKYSKILRKSIDSNFFKHLQSLNCILIVTSVPESTLS